MLYDKNIPQEPEALPKETTSTIAFTDGGFYPFLKYLIHKATKVPNENIAIRDYGANNPFLYQGQEPKIFCDLIEFSSPSMSGFFDGYGDMNIVMNTKYRVYFCNDTFRSPLLFEASLKGNTDIMRSIMVEFFETYKDKGFYVPQNITMSSKKSTKGVSVYPIVAYDITMIGYGIFNIEDLENVPFDKFSGDVNIINQ